MKDVTIGFRWVFCLSLLISFSCENEKTEKALLDVTEENRYNKVILSGGLSEPTEFVVLPDKKIILTERRGNVKLFDPNDKSLKVIANIPVYAEQEDGLMGIALDPNFDYNGLLYLYYSPEGPEEKQHLSRFRFTGETIDLSSEIVMLEVKTQRKECCHTGGSIEFGPDGLLYLSTGDDTNPFGSENYAPIDETPGRSPWDAQKSSANTNDLRGKILRIKPMADGTYEIPEGNLFPVGTANTRPEIYVMGCRNPYRIAVDQKRNWLFWGEVGPDAGSDKEGRGPKGHDEINLAREAGNYGWPYFVGDNKAYNRYNFQTKRSGPLFDKNAPQNRSVNNTGLELLPPAQSALIWYPYGYSSEFPMLGKGGRNAMAGPVYYREMYRTESYSLPDHYDGKLFVYDWIRGWIFTVTLTEDGTIASIDPFMPNTTFNYMIDMTLGPEGALYILEYGTGWFTANDDAAIVRIDYNGGNRNPVVVAQADKLRGAAPLKVRFTSNGTHDFDDDRLYYQWEFDDIIYKDSTIEHTFEKAGFYYPRLTVRDRNGNKVQQQLIIEVGNEEPDIRVNLTGNQTFYWEGEERNYEVTLADKEDGKLGETISEKAVKFHVDYLAEGLDLTGANQNLGHQIISKGESLINENDCKSCHKIKEKSIGPSYQAVAQRYANRPDAVTYLSQKVINGGAGNWGEQAMSAHPELSEADATEIVKYILTIGVEEKKEQLPLQGSYTFDRGNADNKTGMYVISAAYTDEGANGMEPIQSKDQIILKDPQVEAEDYDEGKQVTIFDFKGERKFVNDLYNNSWLSYKAINLTNIDQIVLGVLYDNSGRSIDGIVELRKDSPAGQLIGKVEMDSESVNYPIITIDQNETVDLYFVFKAKDGKDVEEKFHPLDWIYFNKKGDSDNSWRIN
ncbi:MAG: PQQ-dependent sugar dehydrogenase [Cyclobacteriaceae bacterium]